MRMPVVSVCALSSCAYNRMEQCHTPAVTINQRGECGTFYPSDSKGGFMDANCHVGACLASNCKLNQELECKARQISLNEHENHADCTDFERKE